MTDDADEVEVVRGGERPAADASIDPASASAPATSEVVSDPAVGAIGPDAASEPATASAPPGREPRPMIERIGLAFIAVLLAILFGAVSAASWIGGEPFLAVMAGIGCLMTLWVGALTLVRG